MNICHQQKNTGRIDEFDGLRGLLALWVAVSHIFCWCGWADLSGHMPHLVKLFWVRFTYASSAVDAFIILSGFVISYLLHSRPQSYRQFMIGRFFRIYPVFLICLALGYIAIYQAPFILKNATWRQAEYFQLWLNPASDSQLAHPLSHLFAHLTLLFGLIPEKILPAASVALVAPAWSISLEWQYYLVAPLMAWMAGTKRGLLCLGLIGYGGFAYSHFWSNAFLPIMLPLFLIGIGSYHLYRWMTSRPEFANLSYVLIGILVAVVIVSWHWIALGIWALVLGCIFASRPSDKTMASQDGFTRCLGIFRRGLLWTPLQKIGSISYPLYLVHWPLIIFFMSGLLHWQPQITKGEMLLIMLSGGLPVILLGAWLLHKLVEAPLMRQGKKYWQ